MYICLFEGIFTPKMNLF